MKVTKKLIMVLCAVAMVVTSLSLTQTQPANASTIEEESNFYGEIQLSNVTDTSAYLNATNIVNAIKLTGCVPRNIRWYLKQGIYGSIPLTGSLSITEESSLSYRMTDLTPGTDYEPFVMVTYFDMAEGVQHIYKSYSQFTTTKSVTETPEPVATNLPDATVSPVATPVPSPSTSPAISKNEAITLKRPSVKGFQITGNLATCIVSTQYKPDVFFEYRIGTKQGDYPIAGRCNGDVIVKISVRGLLSMQVRAAVVFDGKTIYSKWSKKKWAVAEPTKISVKSKGKKSARKLQISFSKVNGVKKYMVCYRNPGKKTWHTLCTTNKRTVLSKKLAKKKKVEIAVIAKGTVKGKTVKSRVYRYITYYR